MRAISAALGSAVIAAACGGDSVPRSPVGPDDSRTSAVTHVLEGVVGGRSAAGVTPIANASVSGWLQQGDRGRSLRSTRADAEGRYRFDAVPSGAVLLSVYQEGYVQRCAASAEVRADTRLDVELVPEGDVLAGTAGRPDARPLLIGMVYETMSDGTPHPVPGASLFVEAVTDFLAAETRTDAQGRYLLCGLPASVRITATKAGFLADTRPVELTSNEVVIDFEVRRPEGPAPR